MTISKLASGAQNLKLVVLGCGSLGSSILTGVILQRDRPICASFGATTRTRESLDDLRTALQSVQPQVDLQLAPDGNLALAKEADVILLGCPPDNVDDILLLEGMPAALKNKLVLSVVAGLSESRFCQTLGATAQGVEVIRAMPNVASKIHQSTTVIARSSFASSQSFNIAEHIFGCIGQVVTVSSERLDIYTTLCSSGPAYFAHFLNDMVRAAQSVDAELPDDELLRLAALTMKATAELVLKTPDLTAAALKKSVATPGGSTAAGLSVLDGENVPGSTKVAFRASVDRLQEMARIAS